MFTADYIQELHSRTGNDPVLLERVIYAFGLLEALKKVDLPFCFKGGTSLMLLLTPPRRLSTDIDIIVDPATDVDSYIKRAGELFPFLDVEESIRVGKNKIEKRHFRFRYKSPVTDRDVTVLLDVLFEKMQYMSTIEQPIINEFLLTDGDNYTVLMPDVNSILGDKLTVFAPHTTGVPFGVSKELEVAKQLYDCGSLFEAMTDYNSVKMTYEKVVKSEIEYRGLSITPEDALLDTIKGCLSVASRGQYFPEDYEYYKDGISRVRNHIINKRFSGEIAGAYAAKVLLLAASLFSKLDSFRPAEEYLSADSTIKIDFSKPRSFSYLQIVDVEAYKCVAAASKLLKGAEISR